MWCYTCWCAVPCLSTAALYRICEHGSSVASSVSPSSCPQVGLRSALSPSHVIFSSSSTPYLATRFSFPPSLLSAFPSFCCTMQYLYPRLLSSSVFYCLWDRKYQNIHQNHSGNTLISRLQTDTVERVVEWMFSSYFNIDYISAYVMFKYCLCVYCRL